MEVKVCVRNLSKSTTEEELQVLFAQAGEVIAAEIVRDPEKGGSRGFAFVTMSALSEADRAVNLFNAFVFSDHVLQVGLAVPRKQRSSISAMYEL